MAVDTETGLVQVLRSVNVLDLGRAVNPALASGQVEGAVTMGFGYALTEELRFDDPGTVRNAGFRGLQSLFAARYAQMQTVLVEEPEPTGPYGVKSAGEVGINGPAPAIANAILPPPACDCAACRSRPARYSTPSKARSFNTGKEL